MEKLEVFVSSTWTDLQPEREAVERALHRLGKVSFEGMEYFGSRPETSKETCLVEVAKSDLYVGIFAHRYGSIDPETGLSMTELEYRKAEELGKPCYIYLKSDEVPVRPDYIEQYEEGRQKLRALKERLKGTRTLSFFVSPDDLALRVIVDLHHHFSRKLARLIPVPQSETEQFAQWVRDWLAVTNYVIKDFQIRGGRQADVTVELRVKVGARTLVQRILVRCIYREISVADVHEMQIELTESTELTDGWLISPRRVSQVARDEAAKQENLAVYTFDELIDEHANWDRYFTWLEEGAKQRGVDRYYVDLSCAKDDIDPETKENLGTSHYERVDDYIGQWLDDPAKEHISILGEFGTGKTWFCLHYAHEAMQAYKVAKEAGRQRPRLPVLIPLRDYAKAVSVESLFSEFFFRKHEIGLPGYRAFEQLNRMGKLLLIFDGFDEMADKINRQKQVDNFWELARIVVPGAKAILTCRTEHFEFAKAAVKTFWGEEPPTTSPTAQVLLEPPRFEVLNLDKLSPGQIQQVIVKREGEERGSALADRILKNAALADLAGRVASIELIIAALPTLSAGEKIDLGRVYLYASRELLLKNIREKRSFTNMADKVHFLCELAWEMLSTGELRLNFTQFPDRLRQYRPELRRREIDHWKYDLEGQTLLVRDDEGNYVFSHKTMAEFFVAYKFAAELGLFRPDSEWITSYFPAESVPKEQPARQWHEFFTCPDAEGACAQRIVEKDGAVRCKSVAGTCIRVFAPEPLERVAATFGRRVLTPEVRDFVVKMAEDGKRLWEVIEATRGQTFEAVGYLGGNAATILNWMRASFAGRDLAATLLANSDLSKCNMISANLHGADLRNAVLIGAVLADADFRQADLTEVYITEMPAVYWVAWNPDCRFLASAGQDSVLRLWDLSIDRQPLTLMGHKTEINCVDFSPDGRYLASGGEDWVVRLWDLETGLCLRTFEGHQGAVNCVRFSPNGRYLASASSDWKTKIWEIETGRIIHTFPDHDKVWSVCFDPAGRMLATGGADRIIKLWDITTGTCKYCPETHIADVGSLDFSFDGQLLASGSNDQTVCIWKVSSGGLLYQFDANKILVHSLCFSPTGLFLATAGFDQKIRLWEGQVRRGRFQGTPPHLTWVWGNWKRIPLHSEQWLRASGFDYQRQERGVNCFETLSGHTDWVFCVQFSPTGELLASAGRDATIRIWDVDPDSPNFGQCIKVLEQKMQCERMRIGEAKGLEQKGYGKGGKQTLQEFLRERGAVE